MIWLSAAHSGPLGLWEIGLVFFWVLRCSDFGTNFPTIGPIVGAIERKSGECGEWNPCPAMSEEVKLPCIAHLGPLCSGTVPDLLIYPNNITVLVVLVSHHKLCPLEPVRTC